MIPRLVLREALGLLLRKYLGKFPVRLGNYLLKCPTSLLLPCFFGNLLRVCVPCGTPHFFGSILQDTCFKPGSPTLTVERQLGERWFVRMCPRLLVTLVKLHFSFLPVNTRIMFTKPGET